MMKQLGLLLVMAKDEKSASWWYAPDFSAGDAQFFDPKLGPVQLRPVLKSERRPGRFFGPGDRMLCSIEASGFELRAFVRLKPGRRDNTRRNVALAICKVEEANLSLGQEFRRALDAGLAREDLAGLKP